MSMSMRASSLIPRLLHRESSCLDRSLKANQHQHQQLLQQFLRESSYPDRSLKANQHQQRHPLHLKEILSRDRSPRPLQLQRQQQRRQTRLIHQFLHRASLCLDRSRKANQHQQWHPRRLRESSSKGRSPRGHPLCLKESSFLGRSLKASQHHQLHPLRLKESSFRGRSPKEHQQQQRMRSNIPMQR